jgi:hypothetical protein
MFMSGTYAVAVRRSKRAEKQWEYRTVCEWCEQKSRGGNRERVKGEIKGEK